MKGTIQYLGRGLLVLALCGWAVGCGDDDDSGNTDAGTDGGTSGSGGTTGGSGGSTEKDGGGGGTTGGSGGSTSVTKAECIDMTNTAMGSTGSSACSECVCGKDIDLTIACDEEPMCWPFLACYGANCLDVDQSDSTATMMCALNKCGDSIGGATAGAPLGTMVITPNCSDVCKSPSAGNDGGAEDAGN